MLKKTIKYVDYNEIQREEDFYFNLSQAELTEMEMSVNGGFSKYLDKIIKSQDTKEIIKVLKDIIGKSYGEKSVDGKRFQKSDELTNAFFETEAYSELLMELITDEKVAAAFINGIVPKKISEQFEKQGELPDIRPVPNPNPSY